MDTCTSVLETAAPRGDPDRNGQKTQAMLAKILRIDVNGADPGLPYAIPPGNPFADRGAEPVARSGRTVCAIRGDSASIA